MATESTAVSLHELLVARLPADRPVAPDAGRAAWLQRVHAWQLALEPMAGCDIALAHDDAFEFSAALFGAWQAGATPWLPADSLPATLDRLRAAGLVFAGELPNGLQPATPVDDQVFPGKPLDPDRCALVLFTSGSTGEPVAIRKRLRELEAEVKALEAAFGARIGDAVVQGTVSHQHIYGLLFRVLWPLASGRASARARVVYNEHLADLGPGPLALVASPAHLKRLPADLDWKPMTSGLRIVFSSGGPLPADAAMDVRTILKTAPVEVFGSTETGGIAWRVADGKQAPWQPLPGVECRISDERLQVRSRHLPEQAWFTTNDRAVLDAGGRFELLGRADRIVKIEERRVSLQAIESRLACSELLQEARVATLPGKRLLLAVAAVPSPAGRLLLEAQGRQAVAKLLRDWLDGHCEPIALPRRWRFVDALPADARGKTSERALQALFRPLMPQVHWLQRGPESASAQLTADDSLAAFEGHFPQAAILPGVVLVDWAMRLARDAFGIAGIPLRMETLKFQHLVRPGTLLDADLQWRAGQLQFRFTSRNGVHASGKLRFEEAQR